MSKMISKFAAENLARAFGEVCKIRIADERTQPEAVSALGCVHRLMQQQEETGIVLVEARTLRKMEGLLVGEAA